MTTGRELFKLFLEQKSLARPPYIPLIRGLAARIVGSRYESLISDPTLWANSLQSATELFDFDGIVVGFDFSHLAEACGCQVFWEEDRPRVLPLKADLTETPEANPGMKNVIDVAHRVFEVCHHERACFAAITGPATLANQLWGREEGPNRVKEVKQPLVRVTEAFLKTRPDVVIYMEDGSLGSTGVESVHRRIYSTLKNIVSHYNVRMGLYLQGYHPNNISSFSALKSDLYILGPSLAKSLPPFSQLWDLGKEVLGIGLGLPASDLENAKEIIKKGLGLSHEKGGRGLFLTSFGPLTRDINLETLHKLKDIIHQIG